MSSNKPNWANAPKEAEYLTCNRSGNWYWHTQKPEKVTNGFNLKHSIGVGIPLTPNPNWENSLEKRPVEFDYPIYKKHLHSDLAVQFTDLHNFTVIIGDGLCHNTGEDHHSLQPHTCAYVWEDWSPRNGFEELANMYSGVEYASFNLKVKEPNPYAKQFTNRMKQKIKEALEAADGDFNAIDWSTVTYDFYDVANSFEMVNEQVKHATKKQLQSGGRSGGKSLVDDLKEARWSLDEGIKELEADDN